MVERKNKPRRERAKKRSKFVANPFKFTSDLLGGKKVGDLNAQESSWKNI
jgi:hypothetical protein